MMVVVLQIALFVLLNLCIVLLGYRMVKRVMVFSSWLLFIISIVAIYFICKHDTPVVWMLFIIVTTFTGMKVIAVAQAYKGRQLGLTFKQWAVFATGWMGMRAQAFETFGGKPLPNAKEMIGFGLSRVFLGIILIFLAHVLVSFHLYHEFTYPLVSAILLVGFSLILHFGLLGISAGMWRLQGANTYTLFRQPAKSTSLTELWSRRWNIAFSEMTAITIYRPLKNRIGAQGALMASFIFSGLLHELALSVPVNGGYGLPTAYFIIQGLMVLVEKAFVDNKIMILQHKIIGKAWTFFWLIVPMPLLFHTAFLKQIVWPLAGLR